MARLKITYTTLEQDLDIGVSIANLVSAGERAGATYDYNMQEGWIIYSSLEDYASILNTISNENTGRQYSPEIIN